MTVVKIKPSLVIDTQAPEFIRSEYAKFITFLQKYYEYLEQTNNALDVIRHLDTYNDIDEQEDDQILSIFYSLFLPDFPQVIQTDKKFLLKHISEFYSSKGSIESIKAFFRMVYGEEVEVYLPKVDILKLNAGIWKKLFKIKITGLSAGTVYELLGQEIYQLDSITGNKTVRATVVDYIESTGSLVITADNIVLNFDSAQTIYSTRNDTGEAITFTVVNQLAGQSITYGGLNYSAGDVAELSTAVSNTENIVVDGVTYGKVKALILNTTGDNYSTEDEISFDDHYEFLGNNASFVSDVNDTINLSSHALNTGDIVTYRVEPDTTYASAAIGGLTDGGSYFAIKVDSANIRLATTLENANNNIYIDLTSVGSGVKHYIVYPLPTTTPAKAKITSVTSDDLLGDDADSLGDFFTIAEEEDKLTYEDGTTIREEYGETNVFKSVSKVKYVTDANDTGIVPGSLTSEEFSFLSETQDNDTETYTRSSYVKSNGLVRQLLPAVSDRLDNYSIDWASNKGISATLTDEELRIGFAYNDDYAQAALVTPTYPLTFIVEFNSIEDYNNLDFYELSRNWGNGNVPQVKAITSWDYYSAVEYEDLSMFSELQHLGIYPESADTFSNGEISVSQRGFDPVNRPVLVIREVRTHADSSVIGTQRPWEYRFVFKEGASVKVKLFVNPQPIQIDNQILKAETTTGSQTLFTETGEYIIQENYSGPATYRIYSSGGTTFSLTNNVGTGVSAPSVFNKYDKVRIENPTGITAIKQNTVFNNTPELYRTSRTNNAIHCETIYAKAANGTSAMLSLNDESNLLNATDTTTTHFNTAITATTAYPWAGIASNDTGKLVAVRKSSNTIFGVDAVYQQTNEAYVGNWSSASSAPTWTAVQLPTTAVWGHVEYGAGKFVALEGTGRPLVEPKEDFVNGSRAIYSADGINWGKTTLPVGDCWTKLKFVNGKFWALPYGTTADRVTNSLSYTGLEGSTIEVSAPTGAVFSSVVFASYGTPTGLSGDFFINPAQHSPNSVDVVGALVLGKNKASIRVTTPTFGNDPAPGVSKRLYIELEYSYVQSSTAVTSVDGVTWNAVTLPIDKLADIAYGNGMYVATTYNNDSYYLYSADGVTWNKGVLPITRNELNNMQPTGNAFWSGVTFAGNKFIATIANDPSQTGTCLQDEIGVSVDGINWELHTTSTFGTEFGTLQSNTSSTGCIVQTVYNPSSRDVYHIAQSYTFSPNTVVSGPYTNYGRGYHGGGNTGINEIDGIDFGTEATVNPTAALATARYGATGMHSANIGYFHAGWSGPSSLTEIDGIRFSDQTAINPAASSAMAGGHGPYNGAHDATGSFGYQFSGYNASPQNHNTIQRFTFGTETSAAITAVISLARHMGACSWSAATNKGYLHGGYAYTPTTSSEIDGLDMSTETAINPSAVMKGIEAYGSAANDLGSAVIASGNIADVATNDIEKWTFATETMSDPVVTLSTVRNQTGATQNTTTGKGYFSAGSGPAATIDRVTFATTTIAALGVTLPGGARTSSATVSEKTTTVSYTKNTYYNKTITGSASGGAMFTTSQQISPKDYYIGGTAPLKLCETKEDVKNNVWAIVDGKGLYPMSVAWATVRLITDRIDSGDQNSFTKTAKDAQFNIYAKKRSAGIRDFGMNYNRNPLVAMFDDIEQENRNYTSDNKYYIHESINDYADYIILERDEFGASDQVNLEMEIDKRSSTEKLGYVAYPYFATETSATKIVQHNDDINIPNYSKVRVFVDKSVLQSTNDTNRHASLKTFNDYGLFGPTVELTNEKESHDNLLNPMVSYVDGVKTYRSNFNQLVDAYDATPYVNGVIPGTRDYSSGPGEFGNTGVVSFAMNETVQLDHIGAPEEDFYRVGISNEQAYYDNNPAKPSLNRKHYTLSFNTPKEFGDKFDSPFNVAMKNIIDSSKNNLTHKYVSYADKILLDTASTNDTAVVSYKRVPIDWQPIMSNVTFVENYAKELKISTANFAGQSWPAYRDPILKNIQDGTPLLLASGGVLLSWERYQNLPTYLKGLQGTGSVNDADTTLFHASHPTRVYLLRNNVWNAVDLTGWTLLEQNKSYITTNDNAISVYYKDFAVGGPYTIDNNSAMYFFEPRNLGTNNGYGFAKRTGTDTTWDSQVYSTRGFFKDVYVKGTVNQVTPDAELMFGLNTDPTANASYDSLDFSWYFSSGTCNIYENGSYQGAYGTYTPQTVLEIYYDGSNVYYLKDNTVMRVVPRAVGAMLYMDSSFYKLYAQSGITNGKYTSFQNLEFGELVRSDTVYSDRSVPGDYDALEIRLENGIDKLAAEKNIFGFTNVAGNYSNDDSSIAIEFYSPTLAALAATTLDETTAPYHYVLYCDKADYLNVSTDTQKSTYTFYNCWSPSDSNALLGNGSNITDYIVTIRDLSKSDYIIKRKYDALNRQSGSATDAMFKDVWINKSQDDHGKYVKFYSSYANAVAETSPVALTTLGIGTVGTTTEEVSDTVVTANGLTAYNYYGTITDSDVLRTLQFDPYAAVSSSLITIPNHGLSNGDQVMFRNSFEGFAPVGLTDGTIYFVIVANSNSIRLALRKAYQESGTFYAILAADAAAAGKKCYLQLLPRSLDFGSTQFTINAKAPYTATGSDIVPLSDSITQLLSNAQGYTNVVNGRTDTKNLSQTGNYFKQPVDLETGDYVKIDLGVGDSIVDGLTIVGPATVYAYAIRHGANIISFVKTYEAAIAKDVSTRAYFNTSASVFTNTTFTDASESYVQSNVFYMPANAVHNLSIGTALNIYSTGLGLSDATKYYVSSSNFTTTSFSITTATNGTGVTPVTTPSINSLATIVVDQSDSKFMRAPMITGTIKEDVMISYNPYPSRETGIIQSVELQSSGSYNRIPVPKIITLDGRLGSGAEVYPIVEGIGAVKTVEIVDGGTHAVNRTLYMPYSFFSDSMSGNWQIGEVVNKSGTAIGTLLNVNGRYIKIAQNGSATTITYGDTLTGTSSGATAVVGRNMTIAGATNARPTVLSTSGNHYLSAGDLVYVSGINSVVPAGYYYASPKTSTTFYLFTDSSVSTPADTRATSAYTSGGVVSMGIYTATGTALPGEVTLSSANGPTSNYENDKNLLLPTTKLQDSHYYQDYSYAVRSGTSYENWKPYFNKLVHPAGIAVFGEIDYNAANVGQSLLGNTEVVSGSINNTKTATSTTVTIT